MNISRWASSIFIFLLIQLSSALSAPEMNLFAQTIQDSVEISTSPEVRVPSESRLQEISEMEKYRYNEPRESMSLWDRIMLWFQNFLQKLYENTWVEYFIKGSALLIFIIVLVALVNQMLKGEIRSAIRGRKERTLLNLSVDNVDSNGDKIDSLIEKAIAQQNFALAVRLLYQKSLLLLKHHELIVYKQDKTNYDYLFELADHPSATYFDRLTYFHEYIDYGQFEIDEPRFQKIRAVFHQFEKSLNA